MMKSLSINYFIAYFKSGLMLFINLLSEGIMKLNRLTRVFLLALSLVGAVSMTACNTIGGAGKDIQAGGEAIERAAEG